MFKCLTWIISMLYDAYGKVFLYTFVFNLIHLSSTCVPLPSILFVYHVSFVMSFCSHICGSAWNILVITGQTFIKSDV